jgi:hypothetical protein
MAEVGDASHNRPPVRASFGRMLIQPELSTRLLALDLDLSLAEEPSAGVERAVDPWGLDEAGDLLAGGEPLRDGDEAWVLRDAGRALSATVVAVDADRVLVRALAPCPAASTLRLLRAVLGHHALQGARTAYAVPLPAAGPLFGDLGFTATPTPPDWPAR